eukprot:UN20291
MCHAEDEIPWSSS